MRSFILSIAIVAIAFGCNKGPDYSNTPEIAYSSINEFTFIDPGTLSQTDSVVITIDFQDGNGDLGTDISDTSTANNFIVETLKSTNGVFNTISLPIELGGKFPELSPENYSGPIDGLLNYGFLIPSTAATSNPDLDFGDTLKFRVYVIDEAGNQSNTIETDPITILD